MIEDRRSDVESMYDRGKEALISNHLADAGTAL